MAEGELGLPADGGAALAPDELLPLEPVQQRLHVLRAHRRERARPEDLPEHGCVLQQRLLLARERIEAGGDDALEALGQTVDAARLLVEPRRAARRRAGSRPSARAAAPARPAGRTLRSSTRGEQRAPSPPPRAARARARARSACRRPSPAAARAAPGRAVQRTRIGDAGGPVDEVVDEVEQHVVGPVDVLEDEHERLAARRSPRAGGARR